MSIPRPRLRVTTPLPFVISTGAQRSGEICGCPSLDLSCGPQRPYPLSSRPERSAVERSAVPSLDLSCGPQRPYPLSSRPERSAVERSAVAHPRPRLRATTPLPFVISTGAQRSGEICGCPFPEPLPRAITALPFVISTAAQWRDLRLPISRPQLRATKPLPFARLIIDRTWLGEHQRSPGSGRAL